MPTTLVLPAFILEAPLYRAFAICLHAHTNPLRRDLAEEQLDYLQAFLPSGSGIDSGSKLLSESSSARLVFSADFHHMDENGFYDGWSEHQVVVTPSLIHGWDLRVTGKDRNQIKEYLADTFHHVLGKSVADHIAGN